MLVRLRALMWHFCVPSPSMTSQLVGQSLASSREVIEGEGQGEGTAFANSSPLILAFSPNLTQNKFF